MTGSKGLKKKQKQRGGKSGMDSQFGCEALMVRVEFYFLIRTDSCADRIYFLGPGTSVRF